MDSDPKYKNCIMQQDVILSKQPVYSPSSHFFGQEKNLPDTVSITYAKSISLKYYPPNACKCLTLLIVFGMALQ